jgi:hypothetical protein
MSIVKSSMADSIQAGVSKSAQDVEQGGFGGVFKVTCFDANGNLKWEDKFHNLVVNVGLKDLNDKYFLGGGYTAFWALGLVDGGTTPSYVAGDQLNSHAGWNENTAYTGTRKTAVFAAASTANPSVITNTASPAVFNMNATATIAGAFLTNQASGNVGILFSEGNFTGGNKSVANGDTVNVTYTFSALAV